MYDKPIFLAYSHHDVELARYIAAQLKGYGYDVWWDHELHAGENFRTTIANQLRRASAVITIFTDHSVNSRWVLDEAARADSMGKLIPIIVGDTEIPIGFGELHYCSIRTDRHTDKGEMAAILDAVVHKTGRRRSKFSEEVFEEELKTNVDAVAVIDESIPSYTKHWFSIVGIVVAPIMVFALAVALWLHRDNPVIAWHEWVKLLHVYSSMIVLGGGIFIFLVLRISDHQPTQLDRIAAGSVATPLFSGWKFAASMQLITGSILIMLTDSFDKPWVYQSTFFYLLALVLWWLGFRRGFDAEQSQEMYGDNELIALLRRERDFKISLALFFTVITLVQMIYKDDADLMRIFE